MRKVISIIFLAFIITSILFVNKTKTALAACDTSKTCIGLTCVSTGDSCAPVGAYGGGCYGFASGCSQLAGSCISSSHSTVPCDASCCDGGAVNLPTCTWNTYNCDFVNCPITKMVLAGQCQNCGINMDKRLYIDAGAEATTCDGTTTTGTQVHYQFTTRDGGYVGCINQLTMNWGDGSAPETIWWNKANPADDGSIRCLSMDPNATFDFYHTYSTAGSYVAQLTVGTHVEDLKPDDTTCTIEHSFANVFCLRRQVVEAPPPCATGFNVTCNSVGTQATIDWSDIPGVASYIVRLDKLPLSDWFNAAGGDQWLTPTLSTVTANIIPDSDYRYDVQGRTASGVVGDRCPFAFFNCPSPKGTITGSVVNEVTGGYHMSTGAACTPGTVVSGLTIGFGGGVTANINQCASDRPYYTKTLFAALTGTVYTVTANVPVGWEALSWGCTSIANGIDYTGTSCPNSGTGTVSATGDGGIVYNVPLKKDEQAHIWFYIQPIAPTCTITGSSKVTFGSTWWGSATTVVEGLNGTVGNADTQIGQSSSLALGTPLGLTGLGSSPVQCSGSRCTISRSWIPTDADVGNTYNFYCRGFNYDASFSVPIRQCRPFVPYTYPSDLDCNGVQNTCSSSGDCITVTVEEPEGWFQVQGGDVHAQTQITSLIPSTATYPFFNLNLNRDINLYPGLISYSIADAYDFSADIDNGPEFSSSKGWLANSSFSPEKTSYSYFSSKFANQTVTPLTDCGNIHTNLGSNNVQAIYKVTGNSGNCSIANRNINVGPANSKLIVLVEGSLSIEGNTTITVGQGSFLAFIVQGNINVDHNTGTKTAGYLEPPTLEGIYVANGTINTGVTAGVGIPQTGNRFIGAGTFFAGDFVFNRDLKDNPGGQARNWNTPAELFIFRPDLVINAPFAIWESKIDWQEVAP